MNVRYAIATAGVLVVAAALQGGLASHISIHGARPDFILIAVLCIGALRDAEAGIISGFAGGLFMAALTGANYGSYLVSRLIAGGFAGEVPPTLFRDRWITTVLAVAGGSVIAETIYFLMAPTAPVSWWLRTMCGEVLYNMILGVPLLHLIGRVIGTGRRW